MSSRRILMTRDSTRIGIVYLLHFDTPFKHARHYIGFTQNLDQRCEDHLRGNGSNLVRHVCAAGIALRLAAEWRNVPQTEEYRLKNWGGMVRYCPICRADAGLSPFTIVLSGVKSTT